ncbi:MAG: hypothetical protein ACR2RB_13720 [Gammaproteobacteria bacterium]
MPIITFDRFEIGIDLRKGRAVADSNRLRAATNAYVTTGWAIQKRPGFPLLFALPVGTQGLFGWNNQVHVFTAGPVFTPDADEIAVHSIPHPLSTVALSEIHYVGVFNGFLYVVAEYVNGDIYHHYLDGSLPTHIEDADNPRSRAVTIAASKVFAVAGDTVRFSSTNNARDWSTVNDAGFLPTGLQADSSPQPLALGQQYGRLIVLHQDSVQRWTVDPDPALMRFEEEIPNTGTIYPRTVVNVSGDVFFLSPFGFRSATLLQFNQNLAEIDIGSPIDPLVRAALKDITVAPHAVFFQALGQYICAIGAQMFVYTYSRTAKVSAWSVYQAPGPIEHLVVLDDDVYYRVGDSVYQCDPEALDDGGEPIAVNVQTAYLNFKEPARMKHVKFIDAVIEGAADIEFLYDERDESRVTHPMRVSGITAPGGLYPVDVLCTALSVRFKSESVEPFRLDAFSLHYDVLGEV